MSDGTGILVALDALGRHMSGQDQQVEHLTDQNRQLMEAVQRLNEQLAALTRERDDLLHHADKAPE